MVDEADVDEGAEDEVEVGGAVVVVGGVVVVPLPIAVVIEPLSM